MKLENNRGHGSRKEVHGKIYIKLLPQSVSKSDVFGFFLIFGGHESFWGTLILLFYTSVDVGPGFQSHGGTHAYVLSRLRATDQMLIFKSNPIEGVYSFEGVHFGL